MFEILLKKFNLNHIYFYWFQAQKQISWNLIDFSPKYFLKCCTLSSFIARTLKSPFIKTLGHAVYAVKLDYINWENGLKISDVVLYNFFAAPAPAPALGKIILSHFESFYCLEKSRSYVENPISGTKSFFVPEIGFFIPEIHFLSPKNRWWYTNKSKECKFWINSKILYINKLHHYIS